MNRRAHRSPFAPSDILRRIKERRLVRSFKLRSLVDRNPLCLQSELETKTGSRQLEVSHQISLLAVEPVEHHPSPLVLLFTQRLAVEYHFKALHVLF
jgi:hypothetical protein